MEVSPNPAGTLRGSFLPHWSRSHSALPHWSRSHSAFDLDRSVSTPPRAGLLESQNQVNTRLIICAELCSNGVNPLSNDQMGMNRRRFLTAAATGLGGSGLASGSPQRPAESPTEEGQVPAYFLEDGEVSAREQYEIEQYIGVQQQLAEGRQVRTRGRPRRAPTYRFLHWTGEPGDTEASFVGPLSLKPELEESSSGYQLNVQMLNFHPCAQDWKGKSEQGCLQLDVRAESDGQLLTWDYCQEFDVIDGITTLGYEYLIDNDKVRGLITQRPNVAIRISLLRNRKRRQKLKRILGIASAVAGMTPLAPLGAFHSVVAGQPSPQNQAPTRMRIPKLTSEGLALTQAVVANFAEEEPIWRSGFTSYSRAAGGSRLRLNSGFWVVLDGGRQVDLRQVKLEVDGDLPILLAEGGPCDINYMVMYLEIGKA